MPLQNRQQPIYQGGTIKGEGPENPGPLKGLEFEKNGCAQKFVIRTSLYLRPAFFWDVYASSTGLMRKR